ncbi:GspH/FimT family pseudopilin [Halomonas pacifica]|uniref:GspH/FimT family pseudopilin n=1 Tax=Bisbaumannia pacifica TaxID=77098 RepID=UPI0023588627|nr:GspH/FimT family pseudopilin [Halomonas pacifica]MDC8805227.1 GspH/FimT family pseudopilin [Halomonas pacifica]
MRPEIQDVVYSTGKAPRQAKGLTLIELLVTIAIAAILATWALPSYQRFSARNEVAAEVLRLKTALAQARNTAVTRRTTITVCPSRDRLACDGADWAAPLVIVQGDADDGDLSDAPLLKELPPGRGTRVSFRQDLRPVRYTALGRSAGHNGTFRVCGRLGTGAQVILSNLGRVRVVSTPDC